MSVVKLVSKSNQQHKISSRNSAKRDAPGKGYSYCLCLLASLARTPRCACSQEGSAGRPYNRKFRFIVQKNRWRTRHSGGQIVACSWVRQTERNDSAWFDDDCYILLGRFHWWVAVFVLAYLPVSRFCLIFIDESFQSHTYRVFVRVGQRPSRLCLWTFFAVFHFDGMSLCSFVAYKGNSPETLHFCFHSGFVCHWITRTRSILIDLQNKNKMAADPTDIVAHCRK